MLAISGSTAGNVAAQDGVDRPSTGPHSVRHARATSFLLPKPQPNAEALRKAIAGGAAARRYRGVLRLVIDHCCYVT